MLQIRRLYTNGRSISPIMADLISESIEIKGLGFRSIKLIPYIEALGLNDIDELADIMWKRPKTGEFDSLEWLEAIGRAVELEWDPSKFNLVYHSSGYDSRIISHFLCKSYKRRPGPILFVCIEPEGDQFKKIMKYQGWDESQWAIYDKFANPFNLLFNFNTVWKGFNRPSKFPMNMSTTCIEYLQILEKVPMDLSRVVLWTGLHMNELFKSPRTLAQTIRRRYSHDWHTVWGPTCSAIIAPILSIQSLRAIFSKPRRERFRNQKGAVEMLDPGLANIGNWRPVPERPIPPLVSNRMIEDFKSSYYYRFIKQVPIPENITNSYFKGNWAFWRIWTFASLVEHLVESGVDVRY